MIGRLRIRATVAPAPPWQGWIATLWQVAFAQSPDTGTQRQARREALASQQQFETFFLQHTARITAYLWRMTGDEQTAIDLCQETFLSAWRHYPEVQTYQHAGAWLYRVATNFALRHLQRTERQRGHDLPLAAVPEPETPDPSDAIIESEVVRRILLSLAPRQRAALILRAVDGLSCDEIGTALGVSRDAAKMVLARGRVQFRAGYLEAEGES